MTNFDDVAETNQEQIFSYFDLTTLRKSTISVSKNWKNLSKQAIKTYYLNSTQHEFAKAFATSIFKKDDFVFNILKDIIDNENTQLRIEYNWYFAGGGKEYKFEISSADSDDEYWGTSLLYFALNERNLNLADYLITGIEKTTNNPLTNHSSWDTASLINLGFAPDGEPQAKISPLTLVLMNPKYNTHEKQTNKLLAKRLIRLGGKIDIHSEYCQTDLFKHYVDDPLLYILKEERKLRTKIYEEKMHNLEQELSDAKEKIKQLETENTGAEIQPAAKKLKLESMRAENANDSINPEDLLTIQSSNFFNKRH